MFKKKVALKRLILLDLYGSTKPRESMRRILGMNLRYIPTNLIIVRTLFEGYSIKRERANPRSCYVDTNMVNRTCFRFL